MKIFYYIFNEEKFGKYHTFKGVHEKEKTGRCEVQEERPVCNLFVL